MPFSKFILTIILGFVAFNSFGKDTPIKEKSSITILNPKQGTVWNIPDKVTLEWSTVAIDTSKSIRFFLVRNEMVVQELGAFKNDGHENGIELAKNIGSGNRYQVVAIELFPDNKYSIAKKVTPFFTIINKESDERRKKQVLANTYKPAVKSKKSRNKKSADNNVSTTSSVMTTTNLAANNTFQGRKISYTKELTFTSKNITVRIWDHGRKDGDIVSIYLNGVEVVSKYYLTYSKKEFTVELKPNVPNTLFLYAHNLGKAPPNTVSVEIADGTKSENIILNSDLQSCEAVLISVQ